MEVEKKSKYIPRFKSWNFTWNNYSYSDYLFLREKAKYTKYIVFGKEIGEEGTEHLQGMICFDKPKEMTFIQKEFFKGNKLHCEQTICNSAASNYCKKGEQSKAEWKELGIDGPNYGKNADFFEYGILPPDKGKKDGDATLKIWEEGYEYACEGDFDMINRKIFIQNYRTFKEIHRDARIPPVHLTWKRGKGWTETPNIWICGPTGTGKSTLAREICGQDAYNKSPDESLWHEYKDEENVFIEDFDIMQAKKMAYYLKIWGDKYVFTARVLYGSMKIRPKIIVVTSNFSPEDIFNRSEYLNPILERFKVVTLSKKWDDVETTTKLDLFENIDF